MDNSRFISIPLTFLVIGLFVWIISKQVQSNARLQKTTQEPKTGEERLTYCYLPLMWRLLIVVSLSLLFFPAMMLITKTDVSRNWAPFVGFIAFAAVGGCLGIYGLKWRLVFDDEGIHEHRLFLPDKHIPYKEIDLIVRDEMSNIAVVSNNKKVGSYGTLFLKSKTATVAELEAKIRSCNISTCEEKDMPKDSPTLHRFTKKQRKRLLITGMFAAWILVVGFVYVLALW